MKISLDNVNFSSNSGPNSFGHRLAIAFIESGHEIILSDHGNLADVSLVFIEPTGRPLAKKTVHRLDGIWSKLNEFAWRNKSIKGFYDKASAIVFQSKFDKQFITKHWNVPQKSSVIYNGVTSSPVKEFKNGGLAKLRSEYQKVFVCSANWHPQKRLKANIECYLHLRNVLKEKCCLIVLGSNPDYVISDPHIFYAGSVPENVYMEVYSMADWMLHLAWRDHCPNVVIEALSQNTPVICSNDGGTIEIVRDFGLAVHENIVNDFEPFDYDSPPDIDITNVDVTTFDRSITPPDVSMDKCARCYVELFEQIL